MPRFCIDCILGVEQHRHLDSIVSYIRFKIFTFEN